ncbi:thioredoxin family protein [Thiothrix winogradskyi]|uniref:Thioredoxin family protein n=1 Tax=Thiothrix winogradskyi TaxID=96472 RepID=A0ABY3T3C6_9GAMM|nr:thioredoxin family protein [Thiothrix winogradskyi]UJS26361.1 thioredoxin family protein [Thiothrix winogradskyi]
MQIKVLGTGCANCKTTLKLIEEAAAAKGVAVELEKVEDLPSIMGYGVMSTPGVVVDGKVVHAGGIPSKAAIDGWLAGAMTTPAAAAASAGGCCSGGKCGG